MEFKGPFWRTSGFNPETPFPQFSGVGDFRARSKYQVFFSVWPLASQVEYGNSLMT